MAGSQNSAVTGCDPTDFMDHDEISSMDLSGKEPMSSEWTDEKHSMYLKSMEASFVDQLYDSMYLSGWRTQKKHHSQMKSSKHAQSHSHDQFKVYKDGCWQKIKFNKGEPPPGEAGEYNSLQQNPWIQHFRAGVKQDQTIQGNTSFGSQNVGYEGRMLLTCGFANTSGHSPVYEGHQNSSLTEECSDQNFDEGSNEEGATGNLQAMKRMKTLEVASRNDKVR